MTANTAIFQDTLDRLTGDLTRWRQSCWASIPDGGVDIITEADIAAGRYHDFELSPETQQALLERLNYVSDLDGQLLPVANCGTSFCVAGDVCVNNGYTFMAEPYEHTATRVTPTSMINIALIDNTYDVLLDADVVASELLGVTTFESNALFAMWRTLPEIWGIAYALTDGAVTLPEKLPASRAVDRFRDNLKYDVPATETAVETRRAIFTGLLSVGKIYGNDLWVDVARHELSELSESESVDAV